jgi:hypothetical protein
MTTARTHAISPTYAGPSARSLCTVESGAHPIVEALAAKHLREHGRRLFKTCAAVTIRGRPPEHISAPPSPWAPVFLPYLLYEARVLRSHLTRILPRAGARAHFESERTW